MDNLHLNRLKEMVAEFSKEDGFSPTAIPSLRTIRTCVTDVRVPGVYSPSVCMILQGEKDVFLNHEKYTYGPSKYLAISIDLPVIGQVTKASGKEPYLCLQLDLDTHIISDLLLQSPLPSIAEESTRGLFVGNLDSGLTESMTRLVNLLHKPDDIDYLAPLAIREIHYRLLKGPHGPAIAQIATMGSNMNRIAQAIRLLKERYAEPIRVESLAEMVNMSVSSFHFHFKEVTAQSPLQYQKRLRLMEARQLMLTGLANAANAAYQVGYESPSQFSREYAREFGAPPATDISRIRVA